ncbi:thioredoxin family protein [Geoglobus acetivorans]|uniref:Thioredoxin family protein n=1 Tax=Geoglobus acetivorans TaxID=565033 RepID=A0ABZ3H3T2_GEOAI|nr:thioredoxin family protein [Geoglobus acetivorans]
MITIKLLTSPTCPYCPRAREVVKKLVEEERDVMALELSVTTDEGLKEALKFGISGVPAIIINDTDVILGVPRFSNLKRLVEKYRYN